MTRETLIKNAMAKLSQLPDREINEVSDFAEFLLSKLDNKILDTGIQKIVTDAEAFSFLHDEEDLYSEEDLKERYK